MSAVVPSGMSLGNAIQCHFVHVHVYRRERYIVNQLSFILGERQQRHTSI